MSAIEWNGFVDGFCLHVGLSSIVYGIIWLDHCLLLTNKCETSLGKITFVIMFTIAKCFLIGFS
jgi:hypothetical protein